MLRSLLLLLLAATAVSGIETHMGMWTNPFHSPLSYDAVEITDKKLASNRRKADKIVDAREAHKAKVIAARKKRMQAWGVSEKKNGAYPHGK